MAACSAVLLGVVLSGCSGEPAGPPEQQAPVIVPGAPGEEGTVLPDGKAAEQRPADLPNEVDVEYLTMMIPHHQQAVVMTDLVGGRAQDEQVRAIADRIAVSQGAEITMMSTWLSQHGKPVPGTGHDHGGGHDHSTMPGMATPAQLDALRAATGRDFDRQFLDLMIHHHEGAVTMAERQLAGGVQTRAQEMAQDVLTGQRAEIERMHALRAKL